MKIHTKFFLRFSYCNILNYKKMEWLFGKKKTPRQMLQENKRLLNRTMRDLDRERTKMEQQEKKIIADIKKMAKDGQMVSWSYHEMVKGRLLLFNDANCFISAHLFAKLYKISCNETQLYDKLSQVVIINTLVISLWYSYSRLFSNEDKVFSLILQDAVRIMAKDLVRTKRYVKKFIVMKANIQAVSLKISTLQSQDAMMQAMKGVTKVSYLAYRH